MLFVMIKDELLFDSPHDSNQINIVNEATRAEDIDKQQGTS